MPETETPAAPPDDFVSYSDATDVAGDAAAAAPADRPETAGAQAADTAPAAEDTAPVAGAEDAAEDEPVLTPEQQASDAGKALAKQRGSLQKRIDTLTRDRHSSAREAAAARGEAEQLRAELAALKGGKATAPATPEPGTPDPNAPATMPKRDDIGTKYETYEDYSEALARWSSDDGARRGREEVLKELAARDDRARAEAHERAQQEANVERTARIATFREAHADFDTVVSNPALQITGAMAEVLVDDEAGPALAYYLGQHPAECTRIAALSGSRAAAALGELKARVVSPTSSGPTLRATPITKAPAPPKPVGAGPTASSVPLDQLDPDDYIRVRNEQQFGHRGRR